METWQRRVIKRNLPELIQITLCNKTLLALLTAEDLLSDEERNEIDGSQNLTQKADYLYRVLLTRKDAYQLLLESCRKCKQTGVVSILENGELEQNLSVGVDGEINAQNAASPSFSSVTENQFPIAAYNITTITQPVSQQNLSASQSYLANTKTQFALPTNFNPPQNPSDTSNLELQPSTININQPDDEGRTVLHRALMDNQSLSYIKSLIDHGADYKINDKANEGVLHFAVRGGNKENVIFLMSLKSDINGVDELGETPLHKVGFTRNRDCLGLTTLLLDIGGDLLAINKYGNNVAHLFPIPQNVTSDDFKIWTRGMINNGHGSIFAVRGFCGRTPIQSAMQTLDVDLATMKLILESSKGNINREDNNGDTLLLLALSFGRGLQTIRDILQLGANAKVKNKMGNGVEHQAVIGGNKEVILYLMSKGYNFIRKNKCEYTPMFSVMETRLKNFDELTSVLLGYGANLYCNNITGNTIAHVLSLRGDVTCDDFKIWATAMIENGHDAVFTIKGDCGRTPLHFAMRRLDLDMDTVKLITESSKLDINQPDNEGCSVLHLALEFGRSTETVQNLVELGADWKMKGRNGCSVMHFAVRGSNKLSFLFLLSLGADVNARDKFDRTPLYEVPNTKSKEFVGMTKFLLENGANLNVKDRYGDSVNHMLSREMNGKEYREWKKGMIDLGYANVFKEKSVLARFLSSE